MAAQSGRLVGVLALILELRRLEIRKWEYVMLWIWLSICIGTRFTSPGQQLNLPWKSFCIHYQCNRHGIYPVRDLYTPIPNLSSEYSPIMFRVIQTLDVALCYRKQYV